MIFSSEIAGFRWSLVLSHSFNFQDRMSSGPAGKNIVAEQFKKLFSHFHINFVVLRFCFPETTLYYSLQYVLSVKAKNQLKVEKHCFKRACIAR